MLKNADLFINEHEFADFDAQAAVEHLSQAIRFNTTGYVDTSKIDYAEFDRFHDFIRQTYPCILQKGTLRLIGKSMLITLPGTDKTMRPALYMAHQDVVPVVAGTEQDWQHGPFSGDVADGYIWGRGSLDIKNMLIAHLEAMEYLLSKGADLKRTVYLAFGEDEETLNTGAQRIAQALMAQGITLEYVLDEGGAHVSDAGIYGAPGELISPIGIYEKGYADLFIRAQSKGGHSSNPVHGTSLGALAKAIAQIVDHPLPARLPECCEQTLEILKPYITQEPLKTWVQDIPAYRAEILEYFRNSEDLYYQVQTTVAPTMISGGSQAGNVMPQNMEAVINFRLAPQDTTDSLLAYCRELVNPELELGYVQCINASVPSDATAYGYRMLEETLHHYFDRLHFIPALNKGATDAHNYECICRCCLRFGPFLEEESVAVSGVHGTNERLSVRAYMQGIRVLIRLMQHTCIEI